MSKTVIGQSNKDNKMKTFSRVQSTEWTIDDDSIKRESLPVI